MTSLPSSIEVYLEEAGFSGTEIIILKKLLEEDALTLRELAAKTGKSTGALDQAMKKLLKKNIISREMINSTPKYVLHSLQTVSDWMKKDTEQKQQMIVRKFQNFESFLSTIQKDNKRPEMEYFEGIEGLKSAYLELLNRGKVFLQSGPAIWSDDDPLQDFRKQYFHERHRRGIFSRVITHNTPIGRRYQSRDPFEYRQTLLVDPDHYPFMFEKIIAGDTVACFQLKELKACFIRYPELAEEERGIFERMWIDAQQSEYVQKPAQPIIDVTRVPFKTRVFSRIRDFFFSRKNLEVAILALLIIIRLGYALYDYTYNLEINEVSKRLMAIASTAALQINPDDLNKLH
ncbi:MAG TPA: hypothetical protein VHA52_07545, partial [Candidatus Babeliaceae bacterium]|nr:hypothetical protein [Candidatus Babeliaceae bacterium]